MNADQNGNSNLNNKMNQNNKINKKDNANYVSSFRKTWEILSPAVYYYVAYNIVLVLLAFITGAVVNKFFSANMQELMEYDATVSALLSGVAMILGVLPLIPMLKSQLYRNKMLEPAYKPKTLHYLITCVIACASSVGLNILLILTGFVDSSEAYSQVSSRQYGVAFGLGLILYGVLSPVTEEIIFRGLVFNRMKKYYQRRLAIIVSAALFGIWHGNMVQAVYGTCMGILLAYTYDKFKSFLIPCLFHAVANISVYTITYNSRIYEAVVNPFSCIILLLIAGCTFVWMEKGR